MFVIAAGIVFSFIPAMRTSLIHASDGFNQCYPTYVYIGRYIREFIPNLLRYHTVSMFDFTIGYGDDVLTTLNWFGLGNIFYLLAALAPVKLVSVMFTFQSILQLYLAGLAFLWTSMDYSHDRCSRLTGALIYAFSAYALSYGINFPSFLLVFVTFPIIMNGAMRILASDQPVVSKRYIAAIFLLSCSGFYFLYMDIIAIAVYGILYGVFYYRGRVLQFLRTVGSIMLQTVVAVGMSAVILLPVVLAYLRSARSGEQSSNNDIFSFFSAGELVGRFEGVLDLELSGTAIGFTIPVVMIIAIFLFKYRRRHPVLAWGIVICIVGYFIPATGSIMNGFSYSIDRWIYILNYLVAVMTVIVLPELADILREETATRRAVNGIVIAVFLLWIVSMVHGEDDLRSTVLHVIWIGIALLILILIERSSVRILSIYCVACTILTSFLYFAPTRIGGDNSYYAFKNFYTWHEIESSAFANAEGEDGFYRTDIYDSSLNAALVTQTNSASAYYSIANSGPFSFLNERLVSTGVEGSSFTLRGLDGRKALEMFLSVHSYATDRTAEEIVTNDLRLPMGYTYSSYMLEENAAALDPLDRNQNVLKVVELAEAPVPTELTGVTTVDSEWQMLPCDEEYENIDFHDGDHLTAREGAEIRIAVSDDIDPEEQAEYYLVLHGFEWLESGFERHLEIGGKRMRVVPMGSYPGQSTEYMIKVDLTDSVLDSGYITVQVDEGEYSLSGIELRRLEISNYERYYDELTEVVLQDTELLPNRITGQITSDQDRILLMTIPYSTGWTCRIDGVETKVLKADQGFCAVVVGEGSHAVEWSYCTPGLTVGFYITVVSILAMALLTRRTRKFV